VTKDAVLKRNKITEFEFLNCGERIKKKVVTMEAVEKDILLATELKTL